MIVNSWEQEIKEIHWLLMRVSLQWDHVSLSLSFNLPIFDAAQHVFSPQEMLHMLVGGEFT